MDIRGRVMQILKTTQLWKERCIATVLNLKSSWSTISVSQRVIGLMTPIVQGIRQRLHALTQWSIKQLRVVSLTLLAWLINRVIIFVKVILSGLGSLHQKIVAQLPQPASKAQNQNNEPAE